MTSLCGNWSSKGVEVRTCSKFKSNLILKLSVQFHRENWAVQSRFEFYRMTHFHCFVLSTA